MSIDPTNSAGNGATPVTTDGESQRDNLESKVEGQESKTAGEGKCREKSTRAPHKALTPLSPSGNLDEVNHRFETRELEWIKKNATDPRQIYMYQPSRILIMTISDPERKSSEEAQQPTKIDEKWAVIKICKSGRIETTASNNPIFSDKWIFHEDWNRLDPTQLPEGQKIDPRTNPHLIIENDEKLNQYIEECVKKHEKFEEKALKVARALTKFLGFG